MSSVRSTSKVGDRLVSSAWNETTLSAGTGPAELQCHITLKERSQAPTRCRSLVGHRLITSAWDEIALSAGTDPAGH